MKVLDTGVVKRLEVRGEGRCSGRCVGEGVGHGCRQKVRG